jgi:hypothetical protein
MRTHQRKQPTVAGQDARADDGLLASGLERDRSVRCADASPRRVATRAGVAKASQELAAPVLNGSFLHPSTGGRRQLDLFLPGAWSEPMPIHCWAIEHAGTLLLVDSGETAAARDVAFARFDVTVEQELPGALAAVGLSPADVAEVVLTHHHGDHADGVVHISAPVRVNDVELEFAATASSRVMRRVLCSPCRTTLRLNVSFSATVPSVRSHTAVRSARTAVSWPSRLPATHPVTFP